MRLVIKYIMSNKLVSLLILYMVISIFMKIVFAIHILIPCIWKTIFDIECPGCGLTTALINVITLHFNEAYQANPFIFVVIPAGVFYLYKDFSAFMKKQKTPTE